MLLRMDHAAIICSDYAASKHFCVEVLGLKVLAESSAALTRHRKASLPKA